MFRTRFLAVLTSGLMLGTLVAAPTPALAQRRGIGRGPAFRGSSRFVFVGGFGYGFDYPFYDPFWQYPYPYAYPPYGPYGYGGAEAAMRIQVTPKQAEVYVDGYRAGIVDDFDGIFQRLYLPPGGHQIVLYLPGYKTVTQQVYVSPGNTQKIQLQMAPVAPGETSQPPAPPQAMEPPGPGPRGMRVMPPVQLPPGGEMPPQMPGTPPPDMTPAPMPPPPPPPPPTDPAAYGSLTIRVQPGSALVLIDGQRWPAPGSGSALVVRLGEGKHHVEISRPGYVTFSSDVDITRGESTPLDVKLTR